jgi:putative sterol carrier protein
MTYEKIFADVKKVYSKADKSKLDDDFAFQFNITGEGEGIFYVAYRGGILEIAPYDYVDRCASLYASGENFIKLATKKFSLEDAVRDGHINVDGDYDKALTLDRLASAVAEKDKAAKKPKKIAVVVPKTPAKKPAAKRATADVSSTAGAVAMKAIPGETDLV